MKKIAMILLSLGIAASLPHCHRDDWRGLEYDEVSAGAWLQARVKRKRVGPVLMVQMFDLKGDAATVRCYRESKDMVGKYHARIYGDRWIWMLAGDRIEVRLIAHENSDEFRDTGRLKRFMRSFDLAAMERVSGPKLSGRELERFLPKLGKK